MAPVYDRYQLLTFPSRYVIEPVTKEPSFPVVEINRASEEISVQAQKSYNEPNVQVMEIYGIMGVIELIGGKYLIVISGRESKGRILGKEIFRMTEAQVLPFANSSASLSESHLRDEKTYLSMLHMMLDTQLFHFSYTHDLTHTLQRLASTDPQFLGKGLCERAEARFCWNRFLLKSFIGLRQIDRFLIPIMHGFVSINTTSINSKTFDYILITRRSIFNTGTRFFARGVDENGECANFCETEQIIGLDGMHSSFVQTRGSIPLYWEQRPNIRYKLTPKLLQADHDSAIKKHFDTQIGLYGRQTAINLIDQKGTELEIGKQFKARVESLHNHMLRYVAFDFHTECKNMRYDRLSILLDQLKDDEAKNGYFLLDKSGNILERQIGVFRTNCVDCLDRTNVVQSMLARDNLKVQLTKLGVLNPGESLEMQHEFEYVFKNTWADNADAVSNQYSGTGALKTDFTRTGKRTKAGLLQDGKNSAIRYYKNNFSDGFRQDSIDLFLGNYVPDRRKPTPFVGSMVRLLPLVLVFLFSMLVLSLLVPTSDGSFQYGSIIFWLVMILISFRVIFFVGPDLVDQPKLFRHIVLGRYKTM
eukprot:Nk52_evm56s1020 gene=Nk52_evmTU56s1020